MEQPLPFQLRAQAVWQNIDIRLRIYDFASLVTLAAVVRLDRDAFETAVSHLWERHTHERDVLQRIEETGSPVSIRYIHLSEQADG